MKELEGPAQKAAGIMELSILGHVQGAGKESRELLMLSLLEVQKPLFSWPHICLMHAGHVK